MDAATILVGVLTLLVSGGVVALVRIAVGSADRRAHDWRRIASEWREVAGTKEATNAVMAGNVERLIGSVEQLTAAQRESISILKDMAAAGRAAP